MQPNILLIVSDEERRNDWLQGVVELPAHQRLRNDGMDFTRYYTHTSPCSPSRASLYTGRYLADHGVVDNVSFPTHTALDPAIPTIGSLAADNGYHAAYLGKWHLSHSSTPTMTEHGYQDWQGNDVHFTGNAWTGRHFDPIIADQACDWLRAHARPAAQPTQDPAAQANPPQSPWFLTVALVNPHDIMWYPADHLSYQNTHPEIAEALDFIRQTRLGIDINITAPPENYPQLFDRLPDNFADDLQTKPEVQRVWQQVRNTKHWVGHIDLDDQHAWLRGMDYYAWLHTLVDNSLATILDTLDDLGIYDDTTIIYTSDHGDACGAHGLRAKLPCAYEEVMGVPLIVKGPGIPAGTTTNALATHIDLAATITTMTTTMTTTALTTSKITTTSAATQLPGKDLSPVLADPTKSVRDYVLFAQDSAQSEALADCRYALRGFYDGTTKYARYYGVGGGIARDGTVRATTKMYDLNASFEDQDHEWYNTANDPGELENLANGSRNANGKRSELRKHYERLLEIEDLELATPAVSVS